MYRKEYQDTSDTVYLILEDLYEKSCQDYFHTVEKESNCLERKRDLIKINNFTKYLEEYIRSLQKLEYVETIKEVLEKIKNLQSLTILSKRNRNNQVAVIDNSIRLDPCISEEKHRLHIYNEMSKIIHTNWLKDIDYFISEMEHNEKIKTNQEDNYYLTRGFKLIDKATSIDTAENISCFVKGVSRNKKKIIKNQDIFNGMPYATNFHKRGEIQEVAETFSSTIMNSQNNSLKEMSKETFKKDFIRKVISKSKYTLKRDKDLYKMLIYLGRIQEASDEARGILQTTNSLYSSDEFLNNLLEVVDENKKYIKFKK